MDIQKEKHEYLSMLVEHGAITQEQSNSLKLRSGNIELHSNSLVSSLADCINWGWQSWLKAKKQAESALLEQFEINNKLVEQIEKLKAKAQAVPDGFVVVPKEPTQELLNKMQDFFVGAFENGLTGGQSIHCAYIAMIEAQEPAND